MRRIVKLIGILLLVALLAVVGLAAHEGGHGLAAVALGGLVERFTVMPGIQVYPSLEPYPWDGNIGSTYYRVPGLTPRKEGFISLMGSGTTALIAATAAVLLAYARPRGFGRAMLLTIATTWPFDIVAYSVFPSIGLRHLVFIGGYSTEPLDGALALGIPAAVFWIALGAYVIAVYGLVGLSLRTNRGAARQKG